MRKPAKCRECKMWACVWSQLCLVVLATDCLVWTGYIFSLIDFNKFLQWCPADSLTTLETPTPSNTLCKLMSKKGARHCVCVCVFVCVTLIISQKISSSSSISPGNLSLFITSVLHFHFRSLYFGLFYPSLRRASFPLSFNRMHIWPLTHSRSHTHVLACLSASWGSRSRILHNTKHTPTHL